MAMARPHSPLVPAFDRLEPRRLLAITAQIVGSQLQVAGSDEAEVITFAINATSGEVEVSSGDQLFAFDAAGFTSVLVEARAGDDEVDGAVLNVPTTMDGGLGSDLLTGGGGDDALFGREDPDTINGGDGNDTLDGGGKNDLLNGAGGDDELFGRAGLDALDGGLGSDTLDGGSGVGDGANYGARSEDLELSLDGVANDGADGENDQLLRIENLTAGSGNDAITGNALSNVFNDGEGNDTVHGLGGNDTVTSPNGLNPGNDSLDGGSGDDTLNGGNGADTLIGAAGNDRLNGGSGNNLMHGGSGNDTFFSVPFATDSIFGEAGDDTFGGIAFEGSLLDGGSGNDTFVGDSFENLQFFGRAGNDTVTAEFGPGGGNCVFSGGSGADRMSIVASGGSPVFQVTLDDVANDGRTGETHDIRSDFEHVSGRYHEQVPGVSEGSVRLDASALSKGVTLEGGIGADTLIGGSAADLLIGGAGKDSLIGNGGEDVLRGGIGNDRLFGGAGPDSFNGGPDQDFMDADDGEIDLVNGSSGLSDVAEIDEGIDVVSNVETES